MSEEKITLEDLKKQAKESTEEQQQQKTYRQLIVFKLMGEEYALPINQVKEIVITPPTANVPHTPDYIVGVANIRGSVLALLDLEVKFGLRHNEDVNEEKNNFTLVVENEKYKVGLLVKDVPNTLQININDIDSSKEVLQFSSLNEECINGIAKQDDRMIILIDIVKMLDMDEDKNQLNSI